MPLEESLMDIANRIPELQGSLETEEATKNALVMPFIVALGYDVFNPTEVVPEFTGRGKQKRRKGGLRHHSRRTPHYSLRMPVGVTLNDQHLGQLVRYFSTTPARIGVLTNGIMYRFFADLDRPNMMDNKPFLEFDVGNLDESILPELHKFAKDTFDINATLAAASELKYTREIKQILSQQLRSPDEEFVSLLTGRILAKNSESERFTLITDAFPVHQRQGADYGLPCP